MKKKKCLLLGIILILGLYVGMFYGGGQSTAQAMTKKQVEKKIVTLKKEIKKLEKKKKAEEKKEKKQGKGTTAIMGEIICRNPFIVYQSYGDSYYWVTNSNNLNNLFTQTYGYVKLTGKYRKYNGGTCAVCKAVKVSSKSLKYKETISKKKKQLSTYQNSLKEKMLLWDTEFEINQKQKVDCRWMYSGKYNTVKWKSSDTKVATVDSSGVVTGISQGKTVITAICSLSKKETQCVVYVRDYFHVFNNSTGEEIFANDDVYIGEKTLQINCNFDNSNTKDTFTYKCESDENIASISQDGLITFNECGEAKITVSSSYVYTEFTVYYYGEQENNPEDDWNDTEDDWNDTEDDWYYSEDDWDDMVEYGGIY